MPQNTTVTETLDLNSIFNSLSFTVSGNNLILIAPDGSTLSTISLSRLIDGLLYTIDGF